MSQFYDCESEFLPSENGSVGVTKYRSKTSGLTVYFADIDAQVINGYFCFGEIRGSVEIDYDTGRMHR
jgi:hypothetical protein